MLEKINLDRSLEKAHFKEIMPALKDRLYQLQKASWDAKIPVAIVLEGWDAAGKGTSVRALTARLDPRGFKLYGIQAPRTHEKKRPWLWRFWLRLPGQGEWAIFDRSWYGRVLVERVESFTPESAWRRGYREIVEFERTLSDEGCLLIKFFLHISRREQKKRFKKLTKDPLTAWQVTAEDWDHHSKYAEYSVAVEEMLELTETEWAPWTIVEATDRRHARAKIFSTIIAALEQHLNELGRELPKPPAENAEALEKAKSLLI